MKKKIAVLTGAGISAESGISTYRDAGGLWEGHDVTEVASPMGWARDAATVLRFYNIRRRQMATVAPNAAHLSLVGLEEKYDVQIITQNIDNLHERAGSSKILHLHGEIFKMRSTMNEDFIYDCPDDINLGDTAEDGAQLRPHIVWFGEDVPALATAIYMISEVDIVIIIGTSMVVYPANTLVEYSPMSAKIYFVDPKKPNYHTQRQFHFISEKATQGVPELVDRLLAEA